MLTTQADLVNFPIHELEQIESTIVASQKYLKSLQARCDALTRKLDHVTRPATQPATPAATEFDQGYFYRGDLTRRSKAIDIYLDVLQRLWADFPEKSAAMAAAVSAKGRSRVYLAKTATELFPGRTLAWVQLHSRLLADGWYVDTNLSRNQMSGLLPTAVAAAGLKWGEDVKACFWRIRATNRRAVDGSQYNLRE